MKTRLAGMFIGLLLAATAVMAEVPAASTATAPKQAQTMPCGRMQTDCPQAGKTGPSNRGMRKGMGNRMQNGMGPGMQKNGVMGQGMQGKPVKQGKAPATSGQTIRGSQLMTPEERAAYRARLRAAKTPAERAKIRAEHHKEMQERARKLGKTLPPPPR